jgi:hypothetical protein
MGCIKTGKKGARSTCLPVTAGTDLLVIGKKGFFLSEIGLKGFWKKRVNHYSDFSELLMAFFVLSSGRRPVHHRK